MIALRMKAKLRIFTQRGTKLDNGHSIQSPREDIGLPDTPLSTLSPPMLSPVIQSPRIMEEGKTSEFDEEIVANNFHLQHIHGLNNNVPNVVEARDVYLRYGRGPNCFTALQGINMTVPRGAIYGLLGPSGCGKTTLLRCIVGRLKPTEGTIRVFGAEPGTPESGIPGAAVGYMPQELALYTDFTIEETLMYFGRLYDIDEKTLKLRIAQLVKFLDLPNSAERLVRNLSGGQKRRVSLATALVHNPPMLILDEPTVGVDPLLRKSIWNHLVSLAKQGLTVLITTHYIEEARQACVVGLMRHGKLMVQSTPQALLDLHNLPTVEEVFLKLCVMQDKAEENPHDLSFLQEGSSPSDKEITALVHLRRTELDAEDEDNQSSELVPKPSIDSFTSCAKRTRVLFNKNFLRLRRNLPLLLFQFLLPSLEVILFCLGIGQNPIGIPVAVVNQESIPMFGASFLGEINNVTIHQMEYETPEEAIESVRRGDTWAAIVIHRRFSIALQYRLLAILDGQIDNQTLAASKVSVHMDMTNQIMGYTIQKTLLEAFVRFAQSQLLVTGMNPALAEIPVVVEKPIYGSRDQTFTEFMAPGIVLSIAYLASVSLTALAFVVERKEGLLERNRIAGVGATEFIMSQVFTQLIVMLVQVTLLLFFTFFVFGVTTGGQFLPIIALTVVQGLCGMAYGLMISSLCSEENSATMLALGSFYPNLLLSGTVWPIQAMPNFMRHVSQFLPQTLPIESMRYMVSRGWGIQEQEVWLGFVVTLSWLAVFLTLATLIFKLRK